jgi:hypothetical protein
MNKVIYKYVMHPYSSMTNILMPIDAQIISVAKQHSAISIWVECDIDKLVNKGYRVIMIVLTGEIVPEEAETFLGTIQFQDSNYVAHVYDGGYND